MKNNLRIRNTIISLVAGTIGHHSFAGDQLSSPVDDGSFGEAERQRMLLQTLMNRDTATSPAESKSENTSTPVSISITEDVRLGNLSDVKSLKGVTQSFKKDASATGTVEQGNISGSAIGGGVTQKFIGTADAKKIEQGNISGTTIDGDIDQEF